MPKTTKKLVLNQETVRNLTGEHLGDEFCPSNCGCTNGTICVSCVECPTPPA
jgi:hypothetical protein